MILTTNKFVLYRTKIPLSKMTALPLFCAVECKLHKNHNQQEITSLFFFHINNYNYYFPARVFSEEEKEKPRTPSKSEKKEHMMRIRKMVMIDAHSLHVKLFFGHAPRMKPIRITILSAHMGGQLNLMRFLEKLCGKKSCFLKKCQ